jgi:hypothetical protein
VHLITQGCCREGKRDRIKGPKSRALQALAEKIVGSEAGQKGWIKAREAFQKVSDCAVGHDQLQLSRCVYQDIDSTIKGITENDKSADKEVLLKKLQGMVKNRRRTKKREGR